MVGVFLSRGCSMVLYWAHFGQFWAILGPLWAQKLLKNLFCFNLDARSVPEALDQWNFLVSARSIVLEHRLFRPLLPNTSILRPAEIFPSATASRNSDPPINPPHKTYFFKGGDLRALPKQQKHTFRKRGTLKKKVCLIIRGT